MIILATIVQLLQVSTQAAIAIAATQTPAQQAEFWKRWLDSTEWMYKLCAKFSDQMEKLIEQDAKPKI